MRGPLRTTRGAALAVVLLMTSCAVGGGDDAASDGRPPRNLAGTPGSLPPGDATTAPGASAAPTSSSTARRPSTTASASAPGSTASAPGASSATTSQPSAGSPSPAGPPFHPVASIGDGSNDEEGAGPSWADLVRVEIADNGDYARFTVTMAGALPDRVPAGQTYGVGVDLFRTITQVESDYQLFLDGGSDGWFAYLSNGKRYVHYPGTLGIGGTRIVFTVPWSSLGDRTSGRFSAFADWAKERTGDNEFSEDHAPDLGSAAYSR